MLVSLWVLPVRDTCIEASWHQVSKLNIEWINGRAVQCKHRKLDGYVCFTLGKERR